VFVTSNSYKKVLPFPKPSEESAASTIIVQIADERFPVRWEIEGLTPTAPLVLWKQRTKKAMPKIVGPLRSHPCRSDLPFRNRRGIVVPKRPRRNMIAS